LCGQHRCGARSQPVETAFFLSRVMGESIFPGYANRLVPIEDQRISVHVGGTGAPLLLLHGYPQNHATWIKLAGPLAKNFTCVIADLPGYGASSILADAPDHESFSKSRMATLLVEGPATARSSFRSRESGVREARFTPESLHHREHLGIVK
jgi:pimeloyl-ACP methyl ester carboxylesterase